MNYKQIINKSNPYKVTENTNCKLVSYRNIEGKEILIEKKTYQSFLALQKYMKELEFDIDISSAYRSLEEQEELYQLTEKINGKSYAAQYVAKSGYSEHHSGLAIDIGIVEEDNIIVDDNDTLLSRYKFLFEEKIIPALASFGFILRYPKGKKHLTDYAYEPWHYRYVGKHTAQLMYEQQLTLEEYKEKYDVSGILLVDKPTGITSRDVVNEISHIFDTTKVGHNGTLDPIATGLLVVTINQATKINEYITATEKEYIATIKVGCMTDTGDITGKIVTEKETEITKEQLEQVLLNFPKEYEQEVPIYSAVKIAGKKLYEYARNQEEVILPKRLVQIKELELLEFSSNEFIIRTVVSKGCYIRSLIQDIAKIIDVPMTMQKLRRTKQGKFSIEQAEILDKITIKTPLISIRDALDVKVIELPDEIEKKVRNGVPLYDQYLTNEQILFVKNKEVVALYQNVGNCLKIQKKF